MTTGLQGLSSSVAFRQFLKDPNRYLNEYRENPTVEKDLEYFQKNIQKVETVDDLLKDYRLTKVVLGAYGLEEEITRLGRVKKILTENPNDSSALAFRLADNRFRDIASDLRTDLSLNRLKNQIPQERLFNKYVQNSFEVELGKTDPNLRKALTFTRTIDDVGGNIFSVLGDRVLRDVILDTLQIPQQVAIQSVDTQARAITSRLDMDRFVGLANQLGFTQNQVTEAEEDISLLQQNLEYADTARTITGGISDVFQDILDNYAGLTAATDPAGVNAADIAAQETAVPQLIRYEQIQDAQEDALDTINRELNTILSRLDQASDPAADFAAIQSDISSAVGRLNSALSGASITNTFGATENPLLTGSGDVQDTITVDGAGRQFAFTRFDLSDIQTFANDIDTLVSGAATGTDPAILTARSRALLSQDRLEAVDTVRNTEQESYDSVLSEVTFNATLDTAQLASGYRTVTDATDRMDSIEEKLDRIADLTRLSQDRTPAADRSDLITEFETLREEIRTLITTPNNVGATNILNTAPGFSVNYTTGASLDVAGGFDLLTDIMVDLDAGSLDTAANASSLRTSAILGTVALDNVRIAVDPVADELERAYLTFDPQGRVEGMLFELGRSLDLIFEGADVNGINLLSEDQSTLRFDLQSISSSLTLNSDRLVEFELKNLVDIALNTLVSDPANFETAVLNAKERIDETDRQLRRDSSAINFDFGRVGSTLDVLRRQQESEQTGAAGTDYAANEFTLDFINRFLTLNDTSGSVSTSLTSAPDSFLLGLVQPLQPNAGQGGDPLGNILNLVG